MKIKLKENYVDIAVGLGFEKEPNENIAKDFGGKELKVYTTWDAQGIRMYTIDFAIDVPAETVIIIHDTSFDKADEEYHRKQCHGKY